jgi:PTH1 family peptidyl-tRNA hydrolase
MKLIVGLGNPGSEYSETRHNLGYMVINELAKQMKVDLVLEKKLKADVAIFLHNNETLILAKPQTFMNLCGDSVSKITQFYKIKPEDVWVISDDIDLDFGKVRIRVGGSSGGHNGLKDIIAKLGEGFTRFRIGIKSSDLDKIPAEKFVLQKFTKKELAQLNEILKTTTMLIHHALENGIEHSSHHIN